MNAYVDTLAEWYESAERISRTNMPNDGDTIMYPNMSGAYTIEPATFGWVASIIHPDDNVRILHRAPKPKPAWHDAVAVIAHTYERDGDDIPRAFVPQRDSDAGEWRDGDGIVYNSEDLRDVTPLIEAKVTDDMVERLERHFNDAAKASLPAGIARRMLHAALGLETA